MQSIGYGIIMPVYCGAHLLVSPTALSDSSQLQESIRPRHHPTLSALPWSIMCGYILPAAMMSIPWFSPKFHQYLVAVWQVSPVWIVALQYVFSRVSRFHPSPRQLSSVSGLEILDQVYRFAFVLASLTHYIALGVVALRCFPARTAGPGGHAVTFQEVFRSFNFRSGAQISDMVQGAHGFFQYDQYLGSIAAILWATTLRFNVRNKSMSARQWAHLAFEIVAYTLVAGPTGSLLMLLWARDVQVTEAEVHMEHGVSKSST